jgi:hypothetical protein
VIQDPKHRAFAELHLLLNEVNLRVQNIARKPIGADRDKLDERFVSREELARMFSGLTPYLIRLESALREWAGLEQVKS